MDDSEFYAVSQLEGIPNVTRISFRFDNEAIARVDVFPGDGNFAMIVNEEYEEEFKSACLDASFALAAIASNDNIG